MGRDPAFLFYDADAARDVSHMNRLERGCYFDIIQAQKKFGPLSLNAIKKVLGKDFEECWPSLNMCLTYVEDMYFISWLKESIEKRQKYCDGRSKNKKGSKQPKNKENESTYVEHMVNVIVNENVIKENKGVANFSDEWFNEIFDPAYVEGVGMTFKNLDLENEFKIFKLKIRGSPQDYQHRDSGGIRQAFIYQLKNSKGTNGIRNGHQKTVRRADATIEQPKDWGEF